MLKYIDTRLDKYFDSNSPLHVDFEYYNTMWNEIFDYLEKIAHKKPKVYEAEVKRCNDLKNTLDFAYKKSYQMAKLKKKVRTNEK